MVRLKPREYLRRYLEVAPLVHAVFRSIEAKHLARIPMARPILDLGCGSGEFAGVFFASKIETGLDISGKALASAKKSHKYKNLVRADARKLPFKDNYFGTVLSVSVLEHLKEVEPVIAEVFRVLKPSGKFIFTVNTRKADELLFWPAVLKKWGLAGLAARYIEFWHRIFKHRTLWEEKQWQHVLNKQGFAVKQTREIISPAAIRFFDSFLLTAWPSQLVKGLIGRHLVWRPTWLREWLVRKYGGLVEKEGKKGSNLLVVAIKSAPGSG